MLNKLLKATSTLIFFAFLMCTPYFVFSATMSVTADKSEYTEGDFVTVKVSVDTEGEAMNAVQGVLTYPYEKLTLVSITKTNSVLDFWVNKPESLSNGKVSFDGIALSPGYTGSKGTIFTARFIADTVGVSAFDILSASILANDGVGTELLTGITRDEILVKEKVTYVPPTPQEESQVQDISSPPQVENLQEEEIIEIERATTSTTSMVEALPEPEEVEVPFVEPISLSGDVVREVEKRTGPAIPWPLIIIFIFLVLVFIIVLVFTVLSFTRDRQ
jgi:hypothetical protein